MNFEKKRLTKRRVVGRYRPEQMIAGAFEPKVKQEAIFRAARGDRSEKSEIMKLTPISFLSQPCGMASDRRRRLRD